MLLKSQHQIIRTCFQWNVIWLINTVSSILLIHVQQKYVHAYGSERDYILQSFNDFYMNIY